MPNLIWNRITFGYFRLLPVTFKSAAASAMPTQRTKVLPKKASKGKLMWYNIQHARGGTPAYCDASRSSAGVLMWRLRPRTLPNNAKCILNPHQIHPTCSQHRPQIDPTTPREHPKGFRDLQERPRLALKTQKWSPRPAQSVPNPFQMGAGGSLGPSWRRLGVILAFLAALEGLLERLRAFLEPSSGVLEFDFSIQFEILL